MGRETKILLGFLGLLAGVFVGVLSMKLLVPRPPAGAGPDIRHETAATGPGHELVEPPTLSPRAWDFTAAPPLVAAAAPPPATTEPTAAARGADIGSVEYRSRFAAVTTEPAEPLLPAAAPLDLQSQDGGRYRERGTADPFATRASTRAAETVPAQPVPAPASRAAALAAASEPDLLPPVAAAPLRPAAAGFRDTGTAAVRPASALAPPVEPAIPAAVAPRVGEGYTVQQGDSWWSLAETVYGDGRLYRALFAWNRTLDPRVTLAPGTPLEIPSIAKLQAAWPGLIPR